jgi:hypothetical protein
MGLKYVYKYKFSQQNNFNYSSSAENRKVIDIRDHDYLVGFNTNEYQAVPFSFTMEDTDYKIQYTKKLDSKLFLIAEKTDTVVYDMGELIEKLRSRYEDSYKSDIPQAEMLLYGGNNRLDTKIELHTVSFYPNGDSLELNALSGNIFIRKKE